MRIVFVTGGARSGKSLFALREASRTRGRKMYLATAEALDDEMKERIEKHRSDRGEEWETKEEPLNVPEVLAEAAKDYQIVLLDCLTIWLSNVILKDKMARDRNDVPADNITKLTDSLAALRSHGAPEIFLVSNEVGMGIVPENDLARRFRDLAGVMNQKIAELADEVYMVTAGIPVRIK